MREKSITLYSRNGIRLIKTVNIDVKKYHNPVYKYEETSREEVLEKTEHMAWGKSHYEDVRHESKLGFYYYKREYFDSSQYSSKASKSVSYRKYIIWLDGEKYELEYPYMFKSNLMQVKINKYDTRPWDIVPGYKGIPDHFITALYREVLKFIDIMVTYKNTIDFKVSIESISNDILRDLFGSERGPQEQPNNIKILSHGFDLKESFRKRKEE